MLERRPSKWSWLAPWCAVGASHPRSPSEPRSPKRCASMPSWCLLGVETLLRKPRPDTKPLGESRYLRQFHGLNRRASGIAGPGSLRSSLYIQAASSLAPSRPLHRTSGETKIGSRSPPLSKQQRAAKKQARKSSTNTAKPSTRRRSTRRWRSSRPSCTPARPRVPRAPDGSDPRPHGVTHRVTGAPAQRRLALARRSGGGANAPPPQAFV